MCNLWDVYMLSVGCLYIVCGMFMCNLWDVYVESVGCLYVVCGMFICRLWDVYVCRAAIHSGFI